jgi:hypothetical protein
LRKGIFTLTLATAHYTAGRAAFIILRSQLDDGPLHWLPRTETPAAHGWAFSRMAFGGQSPMQTRRKLLLRLVVCCATMSLFVATATVFADELIGALTKVDVEGKKLTIVDKDEKEVEVKVTDETEYPTKKDTKYDLEKLNGLVKERTDAGKKVNVKVTHDKNVASKIEFQKKATKKKDN